MHRHVSADGWRRRVATAICSSALFVALAASAQEQDQEQAHALPSGLPAPTRPLLYMFEHVTLRESAFNYDQDIQALIANPRNAGEPISRIFAKAALRAVGMPNFDVDNMMNDVGPYMRQISFETLRRGGYTIHLMGMPTPEYAPEAYFVAFAYKDGEPLVEGEPAPSTRYFTFEKTEVAPHVFAFGEWDAEGQHDTHGFGDREPTIRDFIGSVYASLGIIRPNAAIDDLILTRWLNRYEEAWETKNAELAKALFTRNASYQETPLDAPMVGSDAIGEYWAGVTAGQEDIDFEAGIISVSGMTGIASWTARFRSVPDDAPVEMHGIFVLEFADAETVSSLREWWHIL